MSDHWHCGALARCISDDAWSGWVGENVRGQVRPLPGSDYRVNRVVVGEHDTFLAFDGCFGEWHSRHFRKLLPYELALANLALATP